MSAWLNSLFSRKPKYRVAEVRFVTYAEGEKLCQQGWELHTEREDYNRKIGWVWLERREPL